MKPQKSVELANLLENIPDSSEKFMNFYKINQPQIVDEKSGSINQSICLESKSFD